MIKEVVFGTPIRIDGQLLNSYHHRRNSQVTCTKEGEEFIFKSKKNEETVKTTAANVKQWIEVEPEPEVSFEDSTHLDANQKPRRGRKPNDAKGS